MYQCIMSSCIMLCYHHEYHGTYVFCKQRWMHFQNYMDKNLPYFQVYGYCKVTNILKNTNTLFTSDSWTI